MKGLNKAYFIGHIGRDPELRTSPTGINVLKLSMATPHLRKEGETWTDTPDWHRLTAFNRDADFLARHGKKGDGIAVECSVRPNKWTGKDNQVHYEVNLIIDRVLWLNSRGRVVTEAPPQHVEETGDVGLVAEAEGGEVGTSEVEPPF